MEAHGARLAPGTKIGDYYLKELISEGSATRTWYAEQISVRREVIVDSLRSAILQNDAVREAFLEDVRAKARVDHPLIGSVFEAVRMADVCFYARERLAGETLERYVERGEKMSPGDVVHILKQVAEANLYLENNNIGAIPIGPHQIYIGDSYLTRLVNMAIGEQRDQSVSTEDKVLLGGICKEILDREQPGATRVNSLCGFMVDREREIPITWEQVRDLSEQVQKQLREKPATAGQEVQTVSLKDKDVLRNLTITIAVTVVLLGIIGAVTWFMVAPTRTHPRDLSGMTEIEAQTVKVGEREIELDAFKVDTYEVTIAEYADFLMDVDRLGMDRFKHRKQPILKNGYYPGGKDAWEQLHQKAKEGKSLSKRIMGVNQPVSSVDWWSAVAYANWKTDKNDGNEIYSLPTEAHWKAILNGEDVSKLSPGEWLAADKNAQDVTSKGVHGLAGGVSEWSATFDSVVDGRALSPVVLGASFSAPEKGASDREIVSRKVSRVDLGFRLIKQNKK